MGLGLGAIEIIFSLIVRIGHWGLDQQGPGQQRRLPLLGGAAGVRLLLTGLFKVTGHQGRQGMDV